MTEDQIKHMVSRFLQWRLPDTFSPDGGVGFAPSFKDEPMRSRHWPIGTNVLDAVQATAMVRHMLEELPQSEGDRRLSDSLADMCDDNEGLRDYATFLENRNWWQRLLNVGTW